MNGTELVERYGDMLYRICLANLRSIPDAEDAVRETLLRYMTHAPEFETEGGRKAWLITVALNQCRTMLRKRSRTVPTDPEILRQSLPELPPQSSGILEALTEVPEKFRLPLILHYVEGYKVSEMAELLQISVSAAKMRLAKGRRLLETIYRKEYLK